MTRILCARLSVRTRERHPQPAGNLLERLITLWEPGNRLWMHRKVVVHILRVHVGNHYARFLEFLRIRDPVIAK